jgi:hypothetical protein
MHRRAFLQQALVCAAPSIAPIGAGLATALSTNAYPRSAAEIYSGIEPHDNRYPPGNVARYGALGDGRTDDTDSINRALSVAQDIYFPPGVYMIRADGPTQTSFNRGTEGGLTPRNNQKLTLDNSATLRAIPNGSTRYNVIRCHRVRNVSIEGGAIQGDRNYHLGTAGEWGHGIGIWHCDAITIRNCIVSDCWGDGIYVDEIEGNGSSNIRIEGVRCTRNRRNGCSVVSATHVRIAGSTFDNQIGTNPQAGLWIEPDVTKSVSDIVVSQCLFYDNQGDGCGASLVRGALVSGIIFDSCRASHCQSGFVLRDVEHGAIISCTAVACEFHGMQIENVSDVSINGCLCATNNRDGLRISGRTTEFAVATSCFSANGGSSIGHGLVIVADPQTSCAPANGHLSSCVFSKNEQHGINIMGGSDIRIADCQFIDNGQGGDSMFANVNIGRLSTVHCERITVDGNAFVVGPQSARPKYHVSIFGGRNCIVTGNDFSDLTAVRSINVSAGSANHIERNIGT